MVTLEFLALILAFVHFGFPLAYYWYAKARWLMKPWDLKIDETYRPKVTVILPTYNEAKFIVDRLNNLYCQEYPKDLLEVIVVDGASTDGTVKLVEKWADAHRELSIKIIKEKVRRGKNPAILDLIKHGIFSGDIVVFTDADAFWDRNAILNAVKYFADETTGALSGSIFYSGETIENVYRKYYNIIRVAESKYHSTPIHNGPFMALRAEILRNYGLPTFAGSDDSSWGSFTAFLGYRALQVDDVKVEEFVGEGRGMTKRKIRRAQHILTNFFRTKKYAKKVGLYKISNFEKIWRVEWFLHVVNPWILLISSAMLVISVVHHSVVAAVLFSSGLLFLFLRSFRSWASQQVYLIIASLRNLWTKQVIWEK